MFADRRVAQGSTSDGWRFARVLDLVGETDFAKQCFETLDFPACEALGLRRATWLTFRRTYSSWAHDKGVPAKMVAHLMGHAKVDTTLNVYTQVLDDSVRAAAGKVGSELFTIVHQPERGSQLTHCVTSQGSGDTFRSLG